MTHGKRHLAAHNVLRPLSGLILLATTGLAAERHMAELEKAFARMDPAETIERLSRITSRITGSPGCGEAADYIEQRFREMGLQKVGTSAEGAFKVVIPVQKSATLTVGEGGEATTTTLHCLWPNLVRTSKLPQDGLAGKLVFGRSGHLAAFRKQPVRDNIVIMDFACSTRWLNAAMLGAKAIIFIEPDYVFRSDAEEKFLLIPLNMPRFWISKQDMVRLGQKLFPDLPPAPTLDDVYAKLGRLDRATIDKLPGVKLEADMVWEEQEARNIVGTIPGIDPELKGETIFIEAYYDSISVVPSLAPGAETS